MYFGVLCLDSLCLVQTDDCLSGNLVAGCFAGLDVFWLWLLMFCGYGLFTWFGCLLVFCLGVFIVYCMFW